MKKLVLILITAVVIVAFSLPAAANDAQWNFYGILKMDTWSIEDSKERDAIHTPAKSDRDTEWSLNPGARIGAKVKKGDIGGGFEYGHRATVDLRLYFMEHGISVPVSFLSARLTHPVTLLYQTKRILQVFSLQTAFFMRAADP